jgi:oligopeptide/dipeptide ABC transporter ATP-binding protein
MNEPNIQPLIEVKQLKTHFRLPQGLVRAVDNASFNIYPGKTLAVVGESGCGKSVTAQSILRIVPPPGRIVAGEIIYHRRAVAGSDTHDALDLTQVDPNGRTIRSIRGAEIALIFQEPMTSLSMVHTIGNQIQEVIRLHQQVDDKDARARAIEMLRRVGMPEPERSIDEYPFRLSGGMRQRAMIAMALACRPQLLIADEPTTALDVTTEAQILELMRELQAELGMAIMFITHDLGVVAEMSDEVVVMYLGRVVETAPVVQLFHEAQHPYTQALLRSIPRLSDDSRQHLEAIAGSVPDPYTQTPGCAFHPRCGKCIAGLCDVKEPPVVQVAPAHRVACHLYAQEKAA